MLILGRDICNGCRYATSYCDLDLSLDVAVVILTFKIFIGLFLGNCKV